MLVAQVSILVVMISISLVVWWLWLRRWRRFGEVWPLEPQPASSASIGSLLLTVAYLWLHLAAVLSPADANDRLPTISAVQTMCAERLALVAVLLPLALNFGARSPRDIGWTLSGWRQQVVDGLETAHASFLPLYFVMFITLPLRRAGAVNPLLRLLQHDTSLPTLAWVLLLAVVLAPLAEELMFRVILLGWLKTKTTSGQAIGISSVAFALVHGPLDGAALMPLALLLGWLYHRRRSYLSVVVAHAVFNLWNIVLTMAARG